MREWLAYLLLPRGILSDLQRDMARVQNSQVEILTRLRAIRDILAEWEAEPPDRGPSSRGPDAG